jgi:hypothetical protein
MPLHNTLNVFVFFEKKESLCKKWIKQFNEHDLYFDGYYRFTYASEGIKDLERIMKDERAGNVLLAGVIINECKYGAFSKLTKGTLIEAVNKIISADIPLIVINNPEGKLWNGLLYGLYYNDEEDDEVEWLLET